MTGNPFTFHDVRTTAATASKDFYGAMFGWTVEEVPGMSFLAGPDGPWAGFTELADGDDRLPMWIPYVPVPDVDAARGEAERLGATVIRERTEVPQGSLVVIAEPGGAVLTLWEDRAA